MNWPSMIGIALWALLPGFIAKKKGRSFWAYYLLSFVITPLITTIITLCLSKKTEEAAPSSTRETIIETKILPSDEVASPDSVGQNASNDKSNEEPTTPRKIMYCRRCGSKLIEGSEFCSKCGNQIEKEEEI